MNNDQSNNNEAQQHQVEANRAAAAAIVSGSDTMNCEEDSEEEDSEQDCCSLDYSSHNSDSGSDNDDRDVTMGDSNITLPSKKNKSRRDKYNISKRDDLYNPNMDDEDEAWVYRHIRSGVEESVSVKLLHSTEKKKRQKQKQNENKQLEGNDNLSMSNMTTPKTTTTTTTTSTTASKQYSPTSNNTKTTGSTQTQNTSTPNSQNLTSITKSTHQSTKILKPRTSDAILSCPCCFQIVCMDCQRHERYANQFRAMFVCNIGVSWDVTLSPEDMIASSNKSKKKGKHSTTTNVYNGQDSTSGKGAATVIGENQEEDVYYSVHCNNCETTVAALDMRDEVYHFFECLASA